MGFVYSLNIACKLILTNLKLQHPEIVNQNPKPYQYKEENISWDITLRATYPLSHDVKDGTLQPLA